MNIWKFAILGVVLALVACSAQTQGTGNAATPPDTGGTANAAGATIVEINMTAQNFAFSPSTITVHKGDHVIIHVTSTDGDHGLGIEGYDAVIERVNEGETQTLEFDATTQGTFTFFCNVPCGSGHRSMKGTLTVL